MHRKVLVIGADVMSSVIDYTDRATCVIFGDGAGGGAAGAVRRASELGMLDYWHEIDGSGAVALNMPGRRLACIRRRRRRWRRRCTMSTRMARAVYKFAVRKMAEAAEGDPVEETG